MKPITLHHYFRLWTVLLILLPSLLVMGIYTIGQIKIGTERNLELLTQLVHSQKEILKQWSAERKDTLRQLSQLEAFRTLDYSKMKDILFLMQHSDNSFSSLAYIDKEGVFQIFTLAGGIQHTEMIGKTSSQGQSLKTEFFSGMVIGRKSRVPIIHFSFPIYDYAGNYQGALIGGVKTSVLAPLLEDNWIGQTGEIRLVNQQGFLLTEPRNARALIQQGLYTDSAILKVKLSDDALQNIQLGQSGTAMWIDHTGKKIHSAYQSMPEYGWTIIGKINEDEIFYPIYNQLFGMAGVTLLVILLCMPLATFLINRIKHPLDWLIEESNRMATNQDGPINHYYPEKNCPEELGILCKTFTTMNHKIKNTLTLLKEKETTLEQEVNERTIELSILNTTLKTKTLDHQVINNTLMRNHTGLLLSERRYKDLFDHMNNACAYYKVLFDATGSPLDLEHIRVNHTYEQHTGYAPGQLVGKSMKEVFPHIHTENLEWITTLLTVALTGEPANFTTYSIYQQRWYSIAAYSPAKGYVVTIGEDITHYQTLKKEIDRLDRLNLIGNMAAGLAHEIRNPLTVIKGYLQYFKKKLPHYLQDQCNLVLSELGRIEGIITVFLSIAKNKSTELELKNLNEIIRDITPLLLTDALKRGVNIECKLSQEIPELLLSEKEIKQLLLNLAMNGLAAMNKQGTLTIETEQQGTETLVFITDSGCGIPENLQHKIFDPFFTTRADGTGLGLSVCTSIAQRHNAIIEICSEEGKGTCFTIRFREPNLSAKKNLPNSLFETW